MVAPHLLRRFLIAILCLVGLVAAGAHAQEPTTPAAQESPAKPAEDPPANETAVSPGAVSPGTAEPVTEPAPESSTPASDGQPTQASPDIAPEGDPSHGATESPESADSQSDSREDSQGEPQPSFSDADPVSPLSTSPQESAACAAATASCEASCSRFDEGDARLAACNNFCQTRLNECAVPQAAGSGMILERAARPELEVAPLQWKNEMLKALEQNAAMMAAIRTGNLKAIRRLVETGGLSPTYVNTYEYNSTTKRFDGRVVRLRLIDVFNDSNVLRNESLGLDRILAEFISLGMDIKATLPIGGVSSSAQIERTAWGPSLKMMETARDRDARLRAFDLAMQAGLVPNDDFGQWLFAELPQTCGRDRSKFSIQVFDLMIKHLGQSLQEPLWRQSERGPETIADLLDRSFAPAQAKTAYDRAQFAQQDQVWENCTLLSRRINRYLMQGQ